ncbi:MAG: Hsp20/alpha crystallin family protein [Deltaproteobacteria bacterium]
MAIIRWVDPLRELSAIHERMNQLFDETFPPARGNEAAAPAAMWSPAVDVYESGDDIVVKAEVPGVGRDDIGVEVKDGMLTLKGERKFEKEQKENYHRIERSYGTFVRSFGLPASVDPEKVRAALKDGVLEVRIGKKEQAKPRKVQVAVN